MTLPWAALLAIRSKIGVPHGRASLDGLDGPNGAGVADGADCCADTDGADDAADAAEVAEVADSGRSVVGRALLISGVSGTCRPTAIQSQPASRGRSRMPSPATIRTGRRWRICFWRRAVADHRPYHASLLVTSSCARA